MSWVRRHLMVLVVGAVGMAAMVAYTWAEYGYFCDQAKDHKQPCPGFWDGTHVHDWVYNAASNWQSELLFGVVLVLVVRAARAGSEERAEDDA